MPNNSNYQICAEEREIDLIQLLFVCLSHYRSLIVACAVGLLLGCVVGFVTKPQVQVVTVTAPTEVETSAEDESVSTDENTENTNIADNNAVVKEVIINDDSLRKMEVAADFYDQYVNERFYLNHSLIMNMDPNKIYNGVIRYELRNQSENAREIHATARKYTDLILDYNIVNRLIEVSGIDTTPQYMREVIAAGAEYIDSTIMYIANTPNPATAKNNGVGKDDYEIVTYTVNLSDEETVTKVLNEIKSLVSELYSTDANSQYSLIELDNYIGYGALNNYNDSRATHVANSNSALNSFNGIYSTFTVEEQKYFDVNYLKVTDKKYAEEPKMEETTPTPTPEPVVEDVEEIAVVTQMDVVNHIVKDAVIGVVGAIFVWFLVFACMFVLTASVKSVDDLDCIAKLPVYGIAKDRKGNKLDKLIWKVIDSRSGLKWNLQYVVKSISGQGLDSVAICNMTGNAEEAVVSNKANWNCIPSVEAVTEPVYINLSSLEVVKRMKNEVLVIAINKTKREDVIAELRAASQHDINIVGIVCI